MKYILVNDIGTTGTRASVIDKENNIVANAYKELTQLYPQPRWVEQDPAEMWEKTLEVTSEVVGKVGAENIAALGIVTQRATIILWDRKTSKPVYNAITWQDGRTADICEKAASTSSMKLTRGLGKAVTGISKVIKPLRNSKTGKLLIQASHLTFTPAMCPPRINWILSNVDEAKEVLARGDLLFGTVDTWILWNYTKGKVYATDFSNVSATGMYDPFSMGWSKTLMKPFGVPEKLKLPEVRESSGDFGETSIFDTPIPIRAAIADQQSALFGGGGFNSGDVKCTNGTGTFIDMNTGNMPMASTHQLTPLIAWKLKGETTYMLEGFIPNTGSAVQWLRDELKVIKSAGDTEAIAKKVDGTVGVYFVPAFEGLTAPYWDARASGTVIGITRAAKIEHIIRAVLESIGYSCRDVLEAMKEDAGSEVYSIKADGAASKNDFILQFISDIANVEIERPTNLETTSLGAAYLAGLAVEFWQSKEEILKYRKVEKVFRPQMKDEEREKLYRGWKRAVERSFNWEAGD